MGLNPVFLVHRQRGKERSKRRGGPSWIEREIQWGNNKKEIEDRNECGWGRERVRERERERERDREIERESPYRIQV